MPERRCWEDWVPGVLSKTQVQALESEGAIKHLGKCDFSAIDLPLGDQAYEMLKGAVKPCGEDYEHLLLKSSYAKQIDFSGEITLERKRTYVFSVQVEFGPSFIGSGRFYGQATGRSTIGRVDVLTRLIVNGMDEYEGFDPEGLDRGKNGKLFLEVTPITFSVKVKPGVPLSQLRLFLGKPNTALVDGTDICKTALRDADPTNDGYLSLAVDPEIYNKKGDTAVAFGAKRDAEVDPIPLWLDAGKDGLDPYKYWTAIPPEKDFFWGRKFVRIRNSYFYILRSKESLAVPSGVAVYCKPSDETIGEMRIHYAGFVHPGFGLHRSDQKQGTPLIFEVRGHDFEVTLMHGEKLARLEFYRMSLDAVDIEPGDYERQSLKLSKLFAPWDPQ